MQDLVRNKPSKKFLWSHQGFIHRILVRLANRLLNLVPFNLKYAIGIKMKIRQPPYSLVKGMNVIQVGAPYDTLNAGRSRGMYFSKLVGDEGRVLIVEPLNDSVMAFRQKLEMANLGNTIVHESGAWSESGESFINVDVQHPATNFTENTVDYSSERQTQFTKIRIGLDTLDNIVEQNSFRNVELISITTNWAEEEILAGSKNLLRSGVKYICLAYGKDGEDYAELMQELGYEIYSHDDRGVTYRRGEAATD